MCVCVRVCVCVSPRLDARKRRRDEKHRHESTGKLHSFAKTSGKGGKKRGPSVGGAARNACTLKRSRQKSKIKVGDAVAGEFRRDEKDGAEGVTAEGPGKEKNCAAR